MVHFQSEDLPAHWKDAMRVAKNGLVLPQCSAPYFRKHAIDALVLAAQNAQQCVLKGWEVHFAHLVEHITVLAAVRRAH